MRDESVLSIPEKYEKLEQVDGLFSIYDENDEYLLQADAQVRMEGDEVKWFDTDLENDQIRLSEDGFEPVMQLMKKSCIDFSQENYEAESSLEELEFTGENLPGSIWIDKNELNKALQGKKIKDQKGKRQFF